MNRILFLVCLTGIITNCNAQAGFEKTFDNATGVSVIQSSDGNFVLAGYTDQYSAGNNDVFLAKVNSAGDTLWSMLYGGTGDDRACMVRETADNGYIIAARTNSFSAGTNDFYLIKTNSTGQLSWSKIYSGTGVNNEIQIAKSVQQTADGGYILTGTTSAFDCLLIKTDAVGDTLWTKSYGGFDYEHGYSVRQTGDGGYILAGSAQSFGGGVAAYLVKTNSSGAISWSKVYYGANQLTTQLYSVDLSNDGGFIAAGNTNNFGGGLLDMYLLKTTSAGVVQWSHTYGGLDYDEAYSVKQLTTDDYVLGGYTKSYGAGGQDYCLIKTNSSGAVTWAEALGGAGYDLAYSATAAYDGGFIITGMASLGVNGMHTVKVDSTGHGSCHEMAIAPYDASQTTIEAAAATTVNDLTMTVTSPATTVHQGATVYTYCTSSCSATGTVLNNVSCRGGCNGFAYATPSGGVPPYTYSWSPSGGQGQTSTGLCAGTYTCSISDFEGCTSIAIVTITEPDSTLTVDAQVLNNVLCNGGSTGCAYVSTTGGTLPYSYVWMPTAQIGDTACNLAPGCYTVSVSDANGCTAMDVVCVTEPDELLDNVSVLNNVSCFGGNDGAACITMTGGTPPFAYSWGSSGCTTATCSGLSAGTYVVTVTDSNGCIINDFVNITEPAAVAANASVLQNVSCYGSCDGMASVSETGGTPPYTYLWTPSGAVTQTISFACSGCYSVTVSDAHGCIVTSTACITQPLQPLSIFIPIGSIQCPPAPVCVAASVTGGTPSYTYSWLPSGGNSYSMCTTVNGTYTISVTDANGCTDSQTVGIAQPAPITVTITTADATCSSCCDGIGVASASGGSPPYWYEWTPLASTAATVSNLCPGNYSCCITDAFGCTACSIDTVSYPTSIATNTANDGITIHPNPFTNQLDVTISRGLETGVRNQVVVTDVLGKEILRREFSGDEIVIDTGDLAGGFYLLRVGGKNYKIVKDQ